MEKNTQTFLYFWKCSLIIVNFSFNKSKSTATGVTAKFRFIVWSEAEHSNDRTTYVYIGREAGMGSHGNSWAVLSEPLPQPPPPPPLQCGLKAAHFFSIYLFGIKLSPIFLHSDSVCSGSRPLCNTVIFAVTIDILCILWMINI